MSEAILQPDCNIEAGLTVEQAVCYLSRMARHSVTERVFEARPQPDCSITAGMTGGQAICLSVTDGQAFRDGKGV